MSRSGTLVLVPGLWLTADSWAPVVAELARRGHRAVVPRLPGVDDTAAGATLEDQLAAVLAAVDAVDRPVVVGHSAAAALAWLAADRRPRDVARVVLVGGFPVADGDRYADLFPVRDGLMPFPGWEPFEGPDADDLDDAARQRLASAAVPVPVGVAQATVRLTDERRFAVPVTVVCPEFSPDDVRSWLEAGELPELERAADVTFVDLGSGHWPMLSRPVELAEVLGALVPAG